MSIIKLNHSLCTGCGACVNACALGAICMEADAEGFFIRRCPNLAWNVMSASAPARS